MAGLGQVWSHGLGNPTQSRYGENVVQLPQDTINAGARGKVTFLRQERDGSGAITIDLSDLYSAPVAQGSSGRAESLYERYGRIRRAVAFGDSGITGMRAMAVDYSGASGAPCLIVMVDRIRGGKDKCWTWQLQSKAEGMEKSQDDPKRPGWITFRGRSFDSPRNGQVLFSESRKIEDDKRVAIREDGFTFTQGEAALNATFIAPTPVKLEFAEKAQYIDGAKHTVRRDSSRAICAEGGDEFFVILTIQKGPAPKVSASGKGLDSVVTVGGQTVRFDGKAIVLGGEE